MTLSVLGVCARTGKFGFATASATPMCGWRSAGAARGLGVYVVQGEEDPRQLSIIARMLAAGLSPAKILKELSEGDEHFERRQIALLDIYGRDASHLGVVSAAHAGVSSGAGYVAIGSGLAGQHVVEAVAQAFARDPGAELECRLVAALEAGRDADPRRAEFVSSGLYIYGHTEIPVLDLRVDIDAAAVAELRRLLDFCLPHMDYQPLIQMPGGKANPDVK